MQNYPKISIVTASFNQARFVTQAIESVLKQNYPNFEHIIFDNCSSDGSVDIFKKYPHLIWASEPDNGQSEALNKGFRKATGEFIGWLNADDLYLPGCFFSMVKFFENFPKADIVYGDYKLIDQGGGLIKLRRELPFDLFMLKYLHVLCIPTAASFFRKGIFDSGNFLDVSYRYAMDYEFFLRLALQGCSFVHIPKDIAEFRWHIDSKSLKQKSAQKQEMECALLYHDSFLKRLHNPLLGLIRNSLMILARAKRVLLKLLSGHYFA